MVTVVNNWYVYEPGDRVFSLVHGRGGTVRAIRKLDVVNKDQVVAVQLRGRKEFVEVPTSVLELKERTHTSIFYQKEED